MKPGDERLAAARGLAAARISTLSGFATRTVHAEPTDRSTDVLVTLLVIVPGSDIDAALAAALKENPRG